MKIVLIEGSDQLLKHMSDHASEKAFKYLEKFGVQIIAIKEIIAEKTTYVPDPDFVIKDSDILILIGDQKQLEKINKL